LVETKSRDLQCKQLLLPKILGNSLSTKLTYWRLMNVYVYYSNLLLKMQHKSAVSRLKQKLSVC